uniref:Uncharacterized protein n=1 Tax=Meloidogyne enterolobii TaxID=390850 RepID=A0A6V7UD49_MELEN|nr:unnamed protein product [Meloidogyne enterolobii]
MQLSGNTIGAYKRKVGHRSRLQNRKEDGQPFLILPNLNKKLKFSKRSLATALIMAIKIGVFIGALAVLFSLVKGETQPDKDVVGCVQALITILHKPPPPPSTSDGKPPPPPNGQHPPPPNGQHPPPPPLPQECIKCGEKCGIKPPTDATKTNVNKYLNYNQKNINYCSFQPGTSPAQPPK